MHRAYEGIHHAFIHIMDMGHIFTFREAIAIIKPIRKTNNYPSVFNPNTHCCCLPGAP